MTADGRAREAERRWRETSDVKDHARWLLLRQRAGDISETRLRLAARLHNPAARLVAAEAHDLLPPAPLSDSEATDLLIKKALCEIGSVAAVRIAIQAVRRGLSELPDQSPHVSSLVRAIDLVSEARLGDPTLLEHSHDLLDLADSVAGDDDGLYNMAFAVACLCRAVSEADPTWASASTQRCRFAMGDREIARQASAIGAELVS